MQLPKLAIFISGSGSLLPGFFQAEAAGKFEVVCVLASRDCPGIQIAAQAGKPVKIIPKANEEALDFLDENQAEVIVLAGYMKIISAEFIEQFAGLIINTHPSLLPKYGGAKMYGSRVHQAVFANSETESGFTVHEVTPEVDAGPIIYQEVVDISGAQTWQEVEERVKGVERQRYPEVVAEHLVG